MLVGFGYYYVAHARTRSSTHRRRPPLARPASWRTSARSRTTASSCARRYARSAGGDLRLTLNAAYNTLNNKVVNLNGTPPFAISGYGASTVQGIVEEGRPVGYLRERGRRLDAAGKITEVKTLQYLGKPTPDSFGSSARHSASARASRSARAPITSSARSSSRSTRPSGT